LSDGLRNKILVVHSSSSSSDDESESEQEDSDVSEQECFNLNASAARGDSNGKAAASRPGQATRRSPAAAAGFSGARAAMRVNGSSSHMHDSSGSSSEADEEDDDEAYDMLLDEDDISETGINGPWGDADSADGSDEGGFGLEEGLTGALQHMLPFLDTAGVTVHLSEFGLLWNTLHGWVSPATVAYVNNRQHELSATGSNSSEQSIHQQQQQGEQADVGSQEKQDEEQQQVHVPPLAVVQQRTALANLLGQALPLVTQQLGIQSLPLPEISKHLHALVRSFYMPGPLPALQAHQWQLLVALFLAALSAWQVPALRPLFVKGQAGDSRLAVMLHGLGSDVDRFMALLDLFELQV
jgi:hypothetical protein